MRYVEHVVDLVGNTPLVRLGATAEGIAPPVLAKVEYLNPGGSVKDRIALRMVEAAEASGELRPGGTIVEPTSGNTGVGLAMVAQRKGYQCVFVCPDKVGEDKRNVLKAYGAEVVVCPTAVDPEHPDSYYRTSDRLVREIEGAWKPNQYANPANPESHYHSTGPEIWQQTEGRITHFVAGIGTGGTISGIGRYLKEKSNGAVRIIGADPEGSVYSGGTGQPYLVEGVGEDFWPTAYDASLVDEIIASSDAESFEFTRRLAREEGLLVGGSSGLAIASGLKAARDLGPDDVMVILLPDGGRGYLGKVFSDTWMDRHGFGAAGSERTVADVLGPVDAAALPHVRPGSTVAEAVAALRAADASALPVLKADTPVVLGEVAGTVTERALADALLAGDVTPADPIDDLLGDVLPLVGLAQPLDVARDALADTGAALVLEQGKPVALLTRGALVRALAS